MSPTVVQALSAVADDVRAVRKDETNKHGGYNFRGIDAVINAVGPAFRRHGIVCMPTTVELLQSVVQTTGGKPQTSTRVLVRYTFHGPAGDHLDAEVWGESWDSSDKGLSQAYSVAYRTCLLQALTIPTDDPDPDSKHPQLAPAAPVVRSATAEQVELIKSLSADLGQAVRDDMRQYVDVQGIDMKHMTYDQAATVLAQLEQSHPYPGG